MEEKKSVYTAADAAVLNRLKSEEKKKHNPKKENRKQTDEIKATTQKKLYCRDITCFE